MPMEAVINADDLIVDGSITGVRTPNSSVEHTITAEAVRNGNTVEATDPDIIRNQYGKLSTLVLNYHYLLVSNESRVLTGYYSWVQSTRHKYIYYEAVFELSFV